MIHLTVQGLGYLLALNTREVDDLARARIKQTSRLVAHDDPIEGVLIRWAVSQAAKDLLITAPSAAPQCREPGQR
ncbi:hypothetical protein EI613_32850 (plasmid) [Azospirillum sp. 412522]|nr:hypothetical protein [Azospirillum sp. 412522]MBY6266634.1 hypothetical protein [Azospirillum sp. 412522]